jgi:ribokinase
MSHDQPGELDILVLAELNPDVVIAVGPQGGHDAAVRFDQVEQVVERGEITLGSSGAITAAAASAQGATVALAAVVGDDAAGRLARQEAAAKGIDVSAVLTRPGRATGLTVVLSRPDGDRALLTFPGTMADLTASDLDDAVLARARHVHVSSFYLQRGLHPGLPDLLAAVRQQGATTSVDPGWDPAEGWDAIAPVLSQVDYLLPNAAECQAISAALPGSSGARTAAADHDVREAAAHLATWGPTVVVKAGADGALVVAGEELITSPSARGPVVETTGAGDCFDAGFLVARLAGAPLADAVRRGVAAATLSLRGWGGTGTLGTTDEIDALAATIATESQTRQPGNDRLDGPCPEQRKP